MNSIPLLQPVQQESYETTHYMFYIGVGIIAILVIGFVFMYMNKCSSSSQPFRSEERKVDSNGGVPMQGDPRLSEMADYINYLEKTIQQMQNTAAAPQKEPPTAEVKAEEGEKN